MRKLLRGLLLRPVLWLVERFSSAPDRARIFEALTKLKQKLESPDGRKELVLPLDINNGRYIVFSDQHKGARNGADDFASAEPSYLEALSYYNKQGFHLICLGDAEELWENTLIQVKRHNKNVFAAERKFVLRNAFTKIFGNHDLDWEINPLSKIELTEIYGAPVRIQEGILLQMESKGKQVAIMCTHGHQGDRQSDGNYFSKFFISTIWAPLQAYLRINPNTPANNNTLKNAHNTMMYEWSLTQQHTILITGHTHQPVFESLTHLERLQQQQAEQQHTGEQIPAVKPTYFNSGCCCFDDGDITGLEIVDGVIYLVKWELTEGIPTRVPLESTRLETLIDRLS